MARTPEWFSSHPLHTVAPGERHWNNVSPTLRSNRRYFAFFTPLCSLSSFPCFPFLMILIIPPIRPPIKFSTDPQRHDVNSTASEAAAGDLSSPEQWPNERSKKSTCTLSPVHSSGKRKHLFVRRDDKTTTSMVQRKDTIVRSTVVTREREEFSSRLINPEGSRKPTASDVEIVRDEVQTNQRNSPYIHTGGPP